MIQCLYHTGCSQSIVLTALLGPTRRRASPVSGAAQSVACYLPLYETPTLDNMTSAAAAAGTAGAGAALFVSYES